MICPYSKKLVSFIFIVVIFTLAACGASEENNPSYEDDNSQISQQDYNNIEPIPFVCEAHATSRIVNAMPLPSEDLTFHSIQIGADHGNFGYGAYTLTIHYRSGDEILTYAPGAEFADIASRLFNLIENLQAITFSLITNDENDTDNYIYRWSISRSSSDIGSGAVTSFRPSQNDTAHDNVSEHHEVRVPSNLDISQERLQQFYDFFHPFLVAFGALPTLGDYDSRTPQSEYVSLEFVLSTGIFIHGRRGDIGIPYYGFTEYIGGEPVSDWSFQVTYEFLSSDYVDYKLLQYFGIEGFNHASIDFTEWFGFEYHDGRYYYVALAQGGASPSIPNIFEIYDYGDGVYFVRIQYLVICPGIDEVEEHLQYNMAVVEVFGESFHMLYWKNDVPRDAEFPDL